MLSHELAKILLENPNLPIATHALNHTYCSKGDSESHGPLKIGILSHYSGEHLIIGDISRNDINSINCEIKKII